MRVLRVLPELDFGGVETRAVLLARGAADAHVDLHVACFHRAGAAAERIRRAGIPVHVLDTSPALRNFAATRALARLLSHLRPDLVHAGIVEANVHATLASLRVPVPRLLVEEVGIPTRGARTACLLAGVYGAADGVVAVSDRVLHELVRREGLDPARATRIYNTARQDFFDAPTPRAAPVHRRITVGRLVPVKNQAVLLEALAGDARLQRCHLTIAGDGPLRGALEQRSRELGLTDRVTFTGFVDDPRALLDAHGTFLLPSLHEGFGIALLEAMARGLLCLASDTSSLQEVLPPGHDDLLFDPHDARAIADAIAGLLDRTSAQRRTLRDRLREHAVSTFSPDAHLRAVLATWERHAARPPTSRRLRAFRFGRAVARATRASSSRPGPR